MPRTSRGNHKYFFTGEYKTLVDKKVWRIYLIQNKHVGGWLESESNLSYTDQCTVDDNAIVSGNSRVLEDARVRGRARIDGAAVISGTADVRGESHVLDDAVVSGCSTLRDTCRVERYARVIDGTISENAHITDQAQVLEGTVSDNACIRHDCVVSHSTVGGNVELVYGVEVLKRARVECGGRIAGKIKIYGRITGNARIDCSHTTGFESYIHGDVHLHDPYIRGIVRIGRETQMQGLSDYSGVAKTRDPNERFTAKTVAELPLSVGGTTQYGYWGTVMRSPLLLFGFDPKTTLRLNEAKMSEAEKIFIGLVKKHPAACCFTPSDVAQLNIPFKYSQTAEGDGVLSLTAVRVAGFPSDVWVSGIYECLEYDCSDDGSDLKNDADVFYSDLGNFISVIRGGSYKEDSKCFMGWGNQLIAKIGDPLEQPIVQLATILLGENYEKTTSKKTRRR
jgi:carbonic anhydrase/acetyltransferase-like protein (isoleucine patch superfamily)